MRLDTESQLRWAGSRGRIGRGAARETGTARSRACGTRMKMVTFDTMITAVTHSVVMKPCEWVVVT